jgi:uncharacterized protein YkwD
MQTNTRKIRRACVAACAIPALALTGTMTASAASAPAAAPPAASEPAARNDSTVGSSSKVLALVNQERQKAGCKALVRSSSLYRAAARHSKDMSEHKTLSHTGSDASTPTVRIEAARYGSVSLWAENIAFGYSTAQKVVATWMASPGHKANILNCSLKHTAIAHAHPGNYWTQVFATH